jgi:parallel beta-helix repeat protein
MVEQGANFIIANNDISKCSSWGIYILRGINGTIINNDLSQNGRAAVNWYSGSNLLFSNNTIRNNAEGLILSHCNQVYIFKNNITDNEGVGITLLASCNNVTVYGNLVAGNGIGFALGSFDLPASGLFWVGTIGDDNYIFRNSFLKNLQQVFIGQSDGNISGVDLVSWDNGSVGNYWSDYSSKYPDVSEIGASGIGDTPYVIDDNNVDRYPLVHQVAISSIDVNSAHNVPELSWFVVVPLLLSLFFVTIFLRYRKSDNL